jgi:hypothetical protein
MTIRAQKDSNFFDGHCDRIGESDVLVYTNGGFKMDVPVTAKSQLAKLIKTMKAEIVQEKAKQKEGSD